MSTTSLVPEELIEQLERENVVPLLGADLAQGAAGEWSLPSQSDLVRELARRSAYPDSDLRLSRVAQHFELQKERHALISFLSDQLINSRSRPQEIHRLLAAHPWRVVVTTSLDSMFERALSEAQCSFTRIVGNTDIAYEDQDKLLLVRMYGSLEQPDSVVVTELDYLRWQDQVENVIILLKGLIASRTLLILGNDLEDEHLRNLYGWVTLPFKRNVRRSYALSLHASAHTTALWKRLGVEIIKEESAAFVEQLFERLRARRASGRFLGPQPSPIAPMPIPRQPYKFLNSYEESDSSIFFGREQEKAQILSKIVSFRLVLLHGKSGTGKTSLIKAGLMPDLRERGYAVTYARIRHKSIEAIQRAFNRNLPSPLPYVDSLHDFLAKALVGSKGTDVLFIDQFEELFSEDFDANARLEFLDALGELYADTSLDLKIVIAIREDALAELSALKQQIPEIFYNDFHLELLKGDQARQAIVNPLGAYGIRYEDGLVDQIISDLGGDNVDPPQLQIVCDHLYAQRDFKDKVISRAQYERLGGARAILAAYLDNVLNRYLGTERVKLQAVLKEFITSVSHRALPTKQDLMQRTGLSLTDLQRVLEELEEARLIREFPPEPRFELVHDYLIPQIFSWTTEEDRAQKRAQEMLEQGFVRWQNFQLPLYVDEFAIINQQCEKLRLSHELFSFLVHSSVWTGSGVNYWLEKATSDQRLQTIQAALEDSNMDRRIRAITLVGRFAVDGLIPALVRLVEDESAFPVRQQAINSLLRLQGLAIVPWLTKMLNGSPEQQRHALEAIDEIQRVTDWDLGETQSLARMRLRLRLRGLRWRQNRGLWQVVTFHAALGGTIGGTLGGALAAILNQDLSSFVVSTILGATFGLLAGTGVGFGFGTVLATREPRRSLLYVLGAASGGSVMGLLSGLADLLPEKMVWSVPIGVLSGAATGSALALLINLSTRFPARLRLMLRLALGTVLGALTTGSLLSVGTQVGSLGGGPPVVPFQPLGALLLGAFTVAGIAVGLEFADRRLESSQEPRQVHQVVKEKGYE